MNATRLKAQIVKEMLSVLRDPKSRVILVAPPLIQLLIFAFAATLEVNNVTIALYDRDHGKSSFELVARIAAADFVGRVDRVGSPRELHEAIDQGRAIAALEIPEGYSSDLAAGRGAEVQVILDGRRANAAQVTLGYLETLTGSLDSEPGGASASETSVVRHWFNPNLIYRWFVVPSLAGILTTFIALLLTALSIARERELGTFDQLLVSPTTPLEIVVAKVVPALVIGAALASLMFAAAIFGFGIPFAGSFPVLFLSLILFMLSVVGLGLMLSSVCQTQQQAILGTFALAVPMVLMSGFATPVGNMPLVLRWVAEAVPLKHFLIITQGSFVKAMPVSEVLVNAWPMVLIALVTLSAATLVVRSKLQ